jgi:hypothetical protein
MMDVFVLLFVVSFLALIFTLAVMHIRKCMNKGKGDITANEKVKTVFENCYSETVSDVATKWKLSLPKHSTRIKLRNSRKLRNKRKEKK